jgi:urease gamma subunit
MKMTTQVMNFYVRQFRQLTFQLNQINTHAVELSPTENMEFVRKIRHNQTLMKEFSKLIEQETLMIGKSQILSEIQDILVLSDKSIHTFQMYGSVQYN